MWPARALAHAHVTEGIVEGRIQTLHPLLQALTAGVRSETFDQVVRRRFPTFIQIVPPTRDSLLPEVAKKSFEGSEVAVVGPPRPNAPSKFALDFGQHAIERLALFDNECSAFIACTGKLLLRIVEAFPRLVQVRLIAWKKRRLTIEFLNFPKLAGVQATLRQRALHGDTKSVLIPLQGDHDSSRVIEPPVQLLLDEPDLLIEPLPAAFEIGLAGSPALQDWRARRPRFRSRDIQRPHSRRDAPDIVPNGFGASPCFRPALPFSTGLMECLDTGLRECFQCVLRVSGPRVRLLRLRKAVVKVGEPPRHVVEPTVQIPQRGVALFYPPRFRWNQPGKNVLDSRLLDGESLQLVLGEELRRPSFVRRRCGVAAGTIDIDDRRTGAEDVATSDLHLLPDRFVVRQRGIDVDPKARPGMCSSRSCCPR